MVYDPPNISGTYADLLQIKISKNVYWNNYKNEAFTVKPHMLNDKLELCSIKHEVNIGPS